MCIIAVVKKGVALPSDSVLDLCWDNNPHNGGFMYVNDKDRIVISKHSDKEEYFNAVRAVHQEYGERTPIVMHMRYATHGSVTLDNCHPFRIDKHLAFAHNGTVNNVTDRIPDGSDYSDTRMLRDLILRKLPPNWWESRGMVHLLNNFVGRSRVAIMGNDRRILYLNKSKWDCVDGIMYSCDWYKRKRPVYTKDDAEWWESYAGGGQSYTSHTSMSASTHSQYSSKCELCGGPESRTSKYKSGSGNCTMHTHINTGEQDVLCTHRGVCDTCIGKIESARNVEGDADKVQCLICGCTEDMHQRRFLLMATDKGWVFGRACYLCLYGEYGANPKVRVEYAVHRDSDLVVNYALNLLYVHDSTLYWTMETYEAFFRRAMNGLSLQRSKYTNAPSLVQKAAANEATRKKKLMDVAAGAAFGSEDEQPTGEVLYLPANTTH